MPNKKPLNSGNPKAKAMAILSESSGNRGSVQRLTAGAERHRSGYTLCVNTVERTTSVVWKV